MRKMQNVLDGLVSRLGPSSSENDSIHRDSISTAPAMEQLSPSLEQQPNCSSPYQSVSFAFRGPTSSEFTLDVVKGSLKAMGLDSETNVERRRSPLEQQQDEWTQDSSCQPMSELSPVTRLLLRDPIWSIGREEALRLIQIYSNGPGSMYPVVASDELALRVETIFSLKKYLEAAENQAKGIMLSETMFSYETNTLKLVLAIALTLEKKDSDDMAQRLFEGVQDRLTTSFWRSSNLNTVVLSILTVGIYVTKAFDLANSS